MKRWPSMTLALAMSATLLPSHVGAQTGDAVGIVTTIDGRASVARPALPSPLALRFKDDVFVRDRISTQEKSLVRVLLGGKAILTVRELSQVTISEEPGRAVVTLPDGKVILAVQKQRMRPGESIEIHTPNAVAAVRGSVLAMAFSALTGISQATCGAGTCTYQFGNAPEGPLPPGMTTRNAQIGSASAAAMDEAFKVSLAGRAVGSPPAEFQTALIQNHTAQAIQVAEFVNTGGIVSTTDPMTLGYSGTPTVPPPINTALTGNPIETGSGGGGGGKTRGPNLLVNGGFETGNLNGWTQSGNLGFTGASNGFYVHSGNFGAFLGPVGSNGFLSQTLGTVVGTPYIVSFSLRSDGGIPNNFSASWAGLSFFSQTDIPARDWSSLSFTEVATASSTVLQFGFRNDPGFLGLDDVSVISDPPLYLLRSGDTLSRAGTDPLLRLSGTSQTFDSLMIVCCGGRVRTGGPLLQATNSDLTVPFGLVSVIQGGSLVSTSTDPLVQLLGGTHTIGSMGLPMFEVAGVNTATDPQTGLTLGTDRPLQAAGPLFEASGATVHAYQAARVDTALLEATAPLLALRDGSKLTTDTDAVQLSYQAKVSSLGSLVRLDRSSLVVSSGAALNLAGGSLLQLTGDLFSLSNGSTLRLLSGPLVSLSGGSILSVSGALVAFGGTGGNTVSVANALCPCTSIGGIPVSLTGGAQASNVSIAGAIKNGGLGSLNLAPNAAIIRVDGAATKVTIKGL